jgi:molybdopterin-guanine dinucleotide biosynthesis protein A
VPVVQGYPQPLAAFYARNCLEVIRAHLDSGGKNSLQAVLERLDVAYVDEAGMLAVDPGLRSFFDLDTPLDLARAKIVERKR